MKYTAKIRDSCKSANSRIRNSVRGKSGNGRLSKQLLHDLRNKIPIRGLIENELGVRCETESGVFRFECPKRAASDLASLSSVLSAMAEPPDRETAERRVRCLEKEVAELKNRTERLLRVVGAILTRRGDAREIFAKIDG